MTGEESIARYVSQPFEAFGYLQSRLDPDALGVFLAPPDLYQIFESGRLWLYGHS
jgi:hypothetical protein